MFYRTQSTNNIIIFCCQSHTFFKVLATEPARDMLHLVSTKTDLTTNGKSLMISPKRVHSLFMVSAILKVKTHDTSLVFLTLKLPLNYKLRYRSGHWRQTLRCGKRDSYVPPVCRQSLSSRFDHRSEKHSLSVLKCIRARKVSWTWQPAWWTLLFKHSEQYLSSSWLERDYLHCQPGLNNPARVPQLGDPSLLTTQRVKMVFAIHFPVPAFQPQLSLVHRDECLLAQATSLIEFSKRTDFKDRVCHSSARMLTTKQDHGKPPQLCSNLTLIFQIWTKLQAGVTTRRLRSCPSVKQKGFYWIREIINSTFSFSLCWPVSGSAGWLETCVWQYNCWPSICCRL